MSGLDRRAFLRAAAASSAGVALGPWAWQAAYAAPATPGPGPYGPLLAPDANGLLLPAGFRSRVLARSGEPVPGTGFIWPHSPDGAAVFRSLYDGWVYVANSEVQAQGGGASAIRFRADGSIADAYPILRGTSGNCSGGATPWGTWLSCEETFAASHVGEGLVWECDPTRVSQGVARPALGRFNHEAVAVEPKGRRLYLSEDRPDGRFYRFTPARYPDLSSGALEAAVVAPDGQVTWVPVPDPAATSAPTRAQVPQATAFSRGEGCWHDRGFVYLATTADSRVWVHDLAAQTIGVLYDAADHADPPLTGVDALLVSSASDLYAAEDGGNMEVVVITRERVVAPVLRYPGNESSELTGLAFDPSGQRLYLSSQRGPAPTGPGVTFEITGPFRQAAASTSSPPPSGTPLAQLQSPSTSPPPPPPPDQLEPSASAPLALVAAGMAGTVWAALWRIGCGRRVSADRDPSILPNAGRR